MTGDAPSPNSLLSVGHDGVARCIWGNGPDDYREYHDFEWGRPLEDERDLFERLSLEAFQSGLSWLTILRKRENFRRAFANFSPGIVADFTDSDRERLMADTGIVRNRRKVDATIANARGVLALREQGGLAGVIRQYVPADHVRPAPDATQLGWNPESKKLANFLKKQGFAHVGPTTCYSMLQACGFINDHVVGCRAGDEIEALSSTLHHG